MDQASPEPTRRRRRRIIAWSLVGLLVVVVVAGVWVVSRALIVRDQLSAIAHLRAEVEQSIDVGQLADLGPVAARFEAHAREAAAAAGDPVWRVAEILPFAGPNLTAVRTVAESLDRLSAAVATPLVSLVDRLDNGGLLHNGSFDVEVIGDAHEPMRRAQGVLGQSAAALSAVPREQLIGEVASGVTDVEDLVALLAETVDGLADVSGVLPRMLGSDEPRSILVMLQNNAELRTGGGITGSFAELRAEAGSLTLVRQADSGEFADLPAPDVEVPASTTQLYGDIVGRFVQNATTTADFTLSGELASSWWRELTGREPDTVISIDPLVLRSLLGVTGPIELADGERLSRDGFVKQVMVTPYLTLASIEQTRYFQGLTERYFDALLSSDAPAAAWVSSLKGPIEQGRVSVWSRNDDEAQALSGSALGGARERHLAAGDSAFAVYLNDTTGAKMDSMLGVSLGTAVGSCRDDHQPEVAVRVHLVNDAPSDAGTAWPESMTGGGHWGVDAGDIGTTVAVAAPRDWFFAGTTVDGERRSSVDVIDGGFPTSGVEVTLAPGESAEVEIRFVAPTNNDFAPELIHTPLLRAADELDTVQISCG